MKQQQHGHSEIKRVAAKRAIAALFVAGQRLRTAGGDGACTVVEQCGSALGMDRFSMSQHRWCSFRPPLLCDTRRTNSCVAGCICVWRTRIACRRLAPFLRDRFIDTVILEWCVRRHVVWHRPQLRQAERRDKAGDMWQAGTALPARRGRKRDTKK